MELIAPRDWLFNQNTPAELHSLGMTNHMEYSRHLRGLYQAQHETLDSVCTNGENKWFLQKEKRWWDGQRGVGVAAWVTKWRPVAALAVSKADLRKAHVAFDNNSNVWKRWAVLSWSSRVVCWSFCARRWYTSLLMMILVSSGVNECRPAHGNVTPWHYSCSVFPFCSVFISTSLLMLFQVFYLYSITTKVYSSPETAGLAPCYVFLLSLLLIPLTPPSLPPLCDVFQAVPEKPQWNCRQAEQSGHPWRRLQYQGHGQRQLHVQMCPHADWWWVQPDQVKSLLRYRQNNSQVSIWVDVIIIIVSFFHTFDETQHCLVTRWRD